MPQIPLGNQVHKRNTIWNPDVQMLNVLVEQTATNQLTGVDHIARPGLERVTLLANFPVQGIFRQAGTLNGDFFAAAGAELYRVQTDGSATYVDNFQSAGRFVAAATSTRIIFVADGFVESTNGVTLTVVNMPDGRLGGSVAQLNGYFIIPEENSARFYWIEPGQTDPDGLSFATTESSPGVIRKVERVGDELWFFKEEGIEVWVPTGDADLPFQRIPGRNYDKGCLSKDSIVRFDNSVAWVGNDGLVYRGDSAPVRFSTHSIEEQIRKSDPADIRAWSFAVDGHTVYCLTITGATYAYDVSSQQWSQFKSYGFDYWRAYVGDFSDNVIFAGDTETGYIYRLDAQRTNDYGEPIERAVTGGVPVVGEPVRCNSFSLYASTGTAADPELYPKVRISWSDDGGQTYGDFEDVSIGRQGAYGEPVELNRLGYMRYPGRVWKVSVTDDAVCTIHAAAYNESAR